MGLIVRAFTRRNIVAIAGGLLLAGALMVAFNFWLSGVINRQGQEETETSARHTLALAESRVAQVVGALDALAARGVDSCAPSNVEAMQRAAFITAPIKELAVVGPDGLTLCTDLGRNLGQRTILSAEPLAGAHGYSLDIIKLAHDRHMVRVRRKVGAGQNIGTGQPVAAEGVVPGRSVQCLCPSRNARRSLDR
jgi:sensor c-di-GMP phosphodiesterase-like protein